MSKERPCVVAVAGASADAPPPGLSEQLPGCDLRFTATPGSLLEEAADAEVLLIWQPSPGWLRASWGALPRLRWIATATAGVDWLLSPGLAASDVAVTNSAGVFDDAMAEYALALVLSACVDLPTTIRLQGRHEWRHRETARLAGRRVLVLGAGGIGRATARLLSRAGADTCCVARQSRADAEFGRIAAMTELPDLLPAARFVIAALPLTNRTRGLIGHQEFALMSRDCWLVNLGRGALVDEPALISALREGMIAGAALDVFAEEPLPVASPLWDLPNVIVSPHMSGDAAGWDQALVKLFTGQFERYQAGKTLMNVVDKDLGFAAAG